MSFTKPVDSKATFLHPAYGAQQTGANMNPVQVHAEFQDRFFITSLRDI
jgi:hypothetical protein